MLSRIGYAFATAAVALIALACLAWSLLVPPPYPVPARGTVVIKDVTLINPGLGRATHVDITLRAGVIASITAASKAVSRDDLHCDGCFALPGLIDMDARTPERSRLGVDRLQALDALRGGVTLVRDPGSDGESVLRLRDRIGEGRVPGPRILACGGEIQSRSAPAAREAARYAVSRGVHCLAAAGDIGRPALLAVAGEAARARVPLLVTAGGREILADAPFVADDVGLAPPPADDCEGDASRPDLVADTVRQHTAHTPLLAAGRSVAAVAAGCGEGWRGQLTSALFHAGAPIYAGSGGPLLHAGSGLRRELAAYVALGLTPDQALVTATTSPGRFWPENTFGQVAIGLPADLALYRQDPTVSLSALDSLDTVIADGRVYPKATLDLWAARYRRHFQGWFYHLFAPLVEG